MRVEAILPDTAHHRLLTDSIYIPMNVPLDGLNRVSGVTTLRWDA